MLCSTQKSNSLFIKSKIQFFESKSQPNGDKPLNAIGCLSSQRYNFLKANHNAWLTAEAGITLFIKSKIQFFESKSQQTIVCTSDDIQLFIKSKIQFFESKSQPPAPTLQNCDRCLSSQRYNFLKANHNSGVLLYSIAEVVYQVKDTIF